MTVHSVSPGLVADAGLAADREERLGAVGSLRNVFQGGLIFLHKGVGMQLVIASW